MAKYLYTGPDQTISVKIVDGGDAKEPQYKEVQFLNGQEVDLDPSNAITKSLERAEYLTLVTTAAPPKPIANPINEPNSKEK